jgi:hypothetical protein
MPHKDDRDRSIQFLLADGHLSGDEHDRILARVMGPHDGGPGRTRKRRWSFALGAVLVPVAAAVALVIGLRRHDTQDQWVVAKGKPSGEGQAVLQARCPGRAAGICVVGDRLMFEVDGASQGGLLAAFAEGPETTAGRGQKIWYFPTREGKLAPVIAREGHVVVAEAAHIGEEHEPGRYTMHLFLLRPTDRTVSREKLAAGQVEAMSEATLPLEVRR